MPPSVKCVAFALATYANQDGSSIFPGNERLTAVTCQGDKTVRRALDWLRSGYLIDRVREGSRGGRRGLADEYRLTIPSDLLTRHVLLDPNETPVTATGGRQEHRSLSPRTPVTEDGTPVTESRITGHGDRTPTQDHPRNQHTNQREDQLGNVSTEGARTGTDNVISLSGWGGRR
jgi:hypothetical protein